MARLPKFDAASPPIPGKESTPWDGIPGGLFLMLDPPLLSSSSPYGEG